MRDLAVIDRKFFGEIATTMDKLTTRGLQAQVESANISRENANREEKERGNLSVSQVQAQVRKVSLSLSSLVLLLRT